MLPFAKSLKRRKKEINTLLFKGFSNLPESKLEYLWCWRAVGFALIAIVVWLSLAPQLPQVGSLFSYDKLGHFLAYATLMGWFAQLRAPRQHLRLALLLIFFGIFLEYLQSLSAIRTPDLFDAIANSLGVLIGWGLVQTPLGKSLRYIDLYLYKSNKLILQKIRVNQKNEFND